MKVTTRERDGVTILDMKGKITIGVGDVALREEVQKVLGGGGRNILINLKDVKTIDSSGIGELVAAYTSATNQGGMLRLFGIPPKVGDILQITQLATVFQVEETEEAALGAF